MTAARVQARFYQLSHPSKRAISIKFNISKALHKKIAEIKKKKKTLPLFVNNKIVSLNDLDGALNIINELLENKESDDATKVTLEKYKTCIMKAILSHLEQLDLSAVEDKKKKDEKPSGILHWLKIGFLVLISLIGLVEGGIDGFLGTNQLLTQLIPQISNAWLIVATLGVTALNVILFIAFEVDLLKNMLGVTTRDNASKILQSRAKQIDLTTKINTKLCDINVITQLTAEEYTQLSSIAAKFNQDIDAKRSLYQEYKEHPVKKGLRWTLTGMGAVLTALGSYFGAASLLAALAASLVGTPVGWVIIGTLVLSSVVFYFAMQGNGMTNLFNSTLEAFNKVKEKLTGFVTKNPNDFDKVLCHKNVFKHDQESSLTKDLTRIDSTSIQRKTNDTTSPASKSVGNKTAPLPFFTIERIPRRRQVSVQPASNLTPNL